MELMGVLTLVITTWPNALLSIGFLVVCLSPLWTVDSFKTELYVLHVVILSLSLLLLLFLFPISLRLVVQQIGSW